MNVLDTLPMMSGGGEESEWLFSGPPREETVQSGVMGQVVECSN